MPSVTKKTFLFICFFSFLYILPVSIHEASAQQGGGEDVNFNPQNPDNPIDNEKEKRLLQAQIDDSLKKVLELDHERLLSVIRHSGNELTESQLGCLCRNSGFLAHISTSYHPGPVEGWDKFYTCGRSGPPCVGKGFGCARRPLPSDPDIWRRCAPSAIETLELDIAERIGVDEEMLAGVAPDGPEGESTATDQDAEPYVTVKPTQEPDPCPCEELGLEDSGVRFSELYGDVIVIPSNDPVDYFSAQLDMVLCEGDLIETRQDSRAILSLRDMSTFALREEGRIEIGAPTEADSVLTILIGNALINIKDIITEGSMNIEQSNAVAGIRGTTFILEEDGYNSTVKVLDGEVEFYIKASGEVVSVEPEQQVTATSEDAVVRSTFSIEQELSNWPVETRNQIYADLEGRKHSDPAQNLASGSKKIAAGWRHTLILDNDGQAWTAGNNRFGELGDGSTDNRDELTRVSMPAGVSFESVSAFGAYSLALDTDGSVWAWGHGEFGQLGIGSADPASSPVRVDLPHDIQIIAIAAGADHSLALDADGSVWAWGLNRENRLGDSTLENRSNPVRVTFPEAAQAMVISAGSSHSLAIDSDGTAWAWGRRNEGQLGNGLAAARFGPTRVTMPHNIRFISIVASRGHSVAIDQHGQAWAWGEGWRMDGAGLGDGSSGRHFKPIQVAMPEGITFTDIATGFSHNLALTADGSVYAWGRNAEGQLGDGSDSPRSTPVEITLPSDTRVEQIAAGAHHSVALTEDGDIWVWGENLEGQLADTTTENRHAPTPIRLP